MVKYPRLAAVHEPLVVGTYYKVPSISIDEIERTQGRYYVLNCMSWVPVWPQLHDDANIGFPEKHYHVDWRFVSDEDIKCIANLSYGDRVYRASIDDILESVILLVITSESVKRGPEERLQCCYRNHLTWPFHHNAPERLEKLLSGAKLKCWRCPHWGFDLSTVKPNEDGIIQCPGHGLCFRADNGQLVPRKECRP